MDGGYGIVFDGTGSWNFDNNDARNGLIVRADNSSSFILIFILSQVFNG